MDPAPWLTNRLRDHVHERGHVVVGDLLALVDGLDGERGMLLDLARVLGRHHALLGQRLDGGHLDLQPRVHARLVGPDGADLGARVALDQAPRMRAASTAALRALSTPTHATGTPGGIRPTATNASTPFITPAL